MEGTAVGRISPGVPNEALAADACRGDDEAFAVLAARCRGLVYAYAYARLRDRDEAEDAVQETFVRAYTEVRRLRRCAAWEPWLMRIARNLCHDLLRRKRIRRAEPIDPSWIDSTPSPEARALDGERRERVAAAVAALPEKYRTPLLLRYEAQRSYAEIAVALGVPETTVVGRLARALQLLRRSLGVEGKR